MRRIHQAIALVALLALVAVPPAPAEDQDPAVTQQQEKRTPQWIGVMCYPVRGALRSQLALPKGKGLVVVRHNIGPYRHAPHGNARGVAKALAGNLVVLLGVSAGAP